MSLPARDTPTSPVVLLVEDNPADARLVEARLADADFACELLQAGGLAEARGRIAERDPDLCLLDLELPDSAGAETVRRFREEAPEVPVVVLTGLDDTDTAVAALRAGAAEYLVKDDLDARRLARTIRHVLERHRIRREHRAAEEKWHTVFEGSPVPMVISDAGSSRLIEVNDAFVEMFGHAREEILGEEATALGMWVEPDRRRELLERLRAEGFFEGEEAGFRDASGERGTMLLAARRLALDEGDRLLWTVQDVTERARRERALAERVKEQACLYDVSRLLHEDERPVADRLQAVVDRLPAGWQYPEATVARLVLEDAVYASEGWEEPVDRLSADLAVDGGEVGELVVGYARDRPDEDLGPFLVEERRLLDELAEQVEVELSRQRARREMRHVVETLSEAVTIVAPDGTITFANTAARELFGEPEGGYVGTDLTDLGHRVRSPKGGPMDPGEMPFQRVLRTGERVTAFEHAIERTDGERISVSVNAAPIRDEDGTIQAVVLSARDVTDQRARQRELEETTERFHALLDTAAGIIFRVSLPELGITYVTPNVGALTGFPAGRWTEDPTFWTELIPEEDLERIQRTLMEATGTRQDQAEEVYRLRHADDTVHWYRSIVRFEYDEAGDPVAFVGTSVDVTERRRLEQRLRHQALHDPLTGLANRTLLDDRLEQAVGRARRQGEGLGVFMVDLDRLKQVNDTLGHAAGDRVLEETARRLESAVRQEDTVARFGGDEFCLLLTDVDDLDDLSRARHRLLERLGRPMRVGDREVTLDATAGAVLYGPPALDRAVQPARPGELIRYADRALHRAKRQPGASAHLFRPETDAADGEQDALAREQDLRRAVAAGEFVIHYQPLVRLEDGRLWGVEPLARWEHPERGLVPPGEFIPLAEETGLIHELGHQLLARMGEDVARWGDAFTDRSLRITPNVSGLQFEEETLVDRLREGLLADGLAPGQVMLEVTETSVMRATHRLQELREMGMEILIDDFGTGYSSLLYLRDLEVDGLKIDMSFVHGLGRGRGDDAIVETILTLGGTLGLEVIAEGIESADQRERLRAMGCALGQGFHLARPMPPGEMADLLERGRVEAA